MITFLLHLLRLSLSFAKTASDSLGERPCASDRPKPTGRRESLMPAALHGKTRFSVGRKGGQKEGEGRMARVGGDESRPGVLDY